MVSASADGTLKVWDLPSGALRVVLEGHRGAVTACAIGRPSGRVFSCSRDTTVKMWDATTGQCLESFYGNAPFVSLSLARGGADVLAAADEAGVVRLLRFTDPPGEPRTENREPKT
jgi:WD40 repeat protein